MTQNKLKFRAPLILKLLLPLMVGVILAFYCPFLISIRWAMVLLILIVILTIPAVSKQVFQRAAFGILSSIFFLLLGYFLAGIHA
tara:strand:- start:941 stop:1195 length:255 start_codon:yes stop_codon:yes gene_type:complete